MRTHTFPTVILLLTVSIALSAETVMIAISEAESSDYFRLSGYGCAEAMGGGQGLNSSILDTSFSTTAFRVIHPKRRRLLRIARR